MENLERLDSNGARRMIIADGQNDFRSNTLAGIAATTSPPSVRFPDGQEEAYQVGRSILVNAGITKLFDRI